MREKKIEQYLSRKVKELGGLCLKFTSPGIAGVPDRIVMLPEGKIFFMELKASGKMPRVLQDKRIQQIRDVGQRVYVADSYELIDEVLNCELRTS